MDSSNHLSDDVGTIRVTYVPAADRPEDKNWAGSDVLRVQAYKDPASANSLHKGAEFPVASPEAMVGLISTLCQVYGEGRRGE